MLDRWPRRTLGILVMLVLLLAACNKAQAPELGSIGSQALENRYIVVLDDVADTAFPGRGQARAAEVARAFGISPDFTYGAAIVGFAGVIPSGRVEALRRDPRVAYVEEDGVVHISQYESQVVPTGIDRIFATGNTAIGIDGTDAPRVEVDVAVIDTGVDHEHPDLNVVGGVTCILTGSGAPWMKTANCDPANGSGDDDHYHGTHVAGTIGALDNGFGVVGVAPGAKIWAVKVLDSSGSGYESQIVAGIDWVAANAGTIEVANMSLGGSGYSQAEYDAIQGAVKVGVAFAVAAGNSDADAKDYSPAAFNNVLTVSALADFNGAAGGGAAATCRTDVDDTLADFSNWGSAVQIAAPGVCILSTYPIEQGEYGMISGTSMASPHAAGALAILASSNNPTDATDVHALYKKVKDSGNLDWTDDSGDGIKEPLLDVSDSTLFSPQMVSTGSDDGGSTNTAPTASFTSACTNLACSFDASGSSDPDGTISSYAWDFGDGATASGVTASHTYAVGGTYTVTLTVKDDGGATKTKSESVMVSEPSTATISLTVTGYKVKGVHHADLTWSGATTESVKIFRDTAVITTDNDGMETDNIGTKGGGSYTYKVCETVDGPCSDPATVTF